MRIPRDVAIYLEELSEAHPHPTEFRAAVLTDTKKVLGRPDKRENRGREVSRQRHIDRDAKKKRLNEIERDAEKSKEEAKARRVEDEDRLQRQRLAQLEADESRAAVEQAERDRLPAAAAPPLPPNVPVEGGSAPETPDANAEEPGSETS